MDCGTEIDVIRNKFRSIQAKVARWSISIMKQSIIPDALLLYHGAEYPICNSLSIPLSLGSIHLLVIAVLGNKTVMGALLNNLSIPKH